MSAPDYLTRPGRPDIALRRREGNGPGLLWLGGYASDMNGTKAQFLDGWAATEGRAFLRFDYSGHGESGGDFDEGGIGTWAGDALAVLDELTDGPQILVGSSMGAWVACLRAKWRPDRLAGLVLIAPAADFTRELFWQRIDETQRATLMTEGRLVLASPYDDTGQVYTRRLIEEGDHNLILSEPLTVSAPVRILQGMKDDVVPWTHAVRLAEHLDTDDVQVTLVKDGDHRLSTPEDLEQLGDTLTALTARIGALR